MKRSDETLTARDMTPAEAAAWEVAVSRGLNITRLDLRYLLEAAMKSGFAREKRVFEFPMSADLAEDFDYPPLTSTDG